MTACCLIKIVRRLTPLLLFAILACVAAPACCSGAQSVLRLSHAEIAATGATRLELTFVLTNADLTLTVSDDNDTAVEAVVTHGESDAAPGLATGTRETRYTAAFSSGSGTAHQEWQVRISRNTVGLLLTLEGSAIEGTIEFGRLPLRSCTLLLTDSSLALGIAAPTSLPLEVLMIAGSGFTLTADGIGNSDVEALGLMCLGSAVEFDMGGMLQAPFHQATALAVNSSVQITVPDDAGSLIKVKTVAASLAMEGSTWQRQLQLPLRKRYITPDYFSQDIQLLFDVFASGSSVRFAQ